MGFNVFHNMVTAITLLDMTSGEHVQDKNIDWILSSKISRLLRQSKHLADHDLSGDIAGAVASLSHTTRNVGIWDQIVRRVLESNKTRVRYSSRGNIQEHIQVKVPLRMNSHTGKRYSRMVIGDGVKSVILMYYKTSSRESTGGHWHGVW